MSAHENYDLKAFQAWLCANTTLSLNSRGQYISHVGTALRAMKEVTVEEVNRYFTDIESRLAKQSVVVKRVAWRRFVDWQKAQGIDAPAPPERSPLTKKQVPFPEEVGAIITKLCQGRRPFLARQVVPTLTWQHVKGFPNQRCERFAVMAEQGVESWVAAEDLMTLARYFKPKNHSFPLLPVAPRSAVPLTPVGITRAIRDYRNLIESRKAQAAEQNQDLGEWWEPTLVQEVTAVDLAAEREQEKNLPPPGDYFQSLLKK